MVHGRYDCDETGRYLLGPDGEFLLAHTHCDQYAGRCMQTLCVLHRHNRGGPKSWFPEKIVAAEKPSPPKRRPARKPPAARGATDLLC